jgi:hypothetical protein
LAAFGSQSCVAAGSHVAAHVATLLPPRQHTSPAGQSAVARHCTPTAFGSLHVVPVSQVYVKVPFPPVTQQI